jgi:L-2-hydroxyglutarate oxidase
MQAAAIPGGLESNPMYDVTIIGAGIVGLASAHKLLELRPGLRVALIDKEPAVAAHQTGHNSGVIHSGIYYRPGSAKARNCRKGYDELLSFCAQHGIEHEICGKLIVAVDDTEKPRLDQLFQRGVENGLEGLKQIGAHELRELEPNVRGVEAVVVPQTGIISYRAVARKLQALLVERGADIQLGAALKSVRRQGSELVLETSRTQITTGLMVNCAGLYSDRVAQLSGMRLDVKVIPFRGEYYDFTEDGEHLVRNLIYPVPDPALPFLGVHFTRKLGGGIEAGPNAVLALRREGYSRWDMHPAELLETLCYPGFRRLAARHWRSGLGELRRSFSRRLFLESLQRLIPAIEDKHLRRGGAGVRAQAVDTGGRMVDDFLILEEQLAIHVVNAPSPAATASLAVGAEVARRALDRLAQ